MGNHNFDIYRKISLLHTKGIYISDILNLMGINEVYVYGIGEMGRIVLSDLSGEITVPAAFDQRIKRQETISIYKRIHDRDSVKSYNYLVFPSTEIPDDTRCILITPATFYYEIATKLKGQGINENRLLSLNLLLYYGMHFQHNLLYKDRKQKFSKKEFLIVGGQFSNVGSQSMIFIAANEIKRRYQNALVWFCPNFWDDVYREEEKYNMLFLTDGMDKSSTLYELLHRLEGIIDISGYALASRGAINQTERNMNYLRMAKEFQIPYYIMPQSFGPFNYNSQVKEELKSLLSYAKIIYAREQEGYDLLINTFDLTNIRVSNDLVLQNKGINRKNIYIDESESLEIEEKYKLLTENNVAIIPNTQNCRYGNQRDVLRLYIDIIHKLISLNKNIYIVSYLEDSVICEDIYEAVRQSKRVHYNAYNFDCFEFGSFIKNFQYIVASRFHAVVYAYKGYRPCIVIGWAEKYQELLRSFKQEKYVFDVREQIDTEHIFLVIDQMEKNYERESRTIASVLPQMQTENCFDILEK